MMRTLRTAALAGLLALGVLATADRADAQMYYSYYPGTSYYYNVTPLGGYQTYAMPGTSYSYYTPNSNWNWTAPGYTSSSYYTMPYTTWDGSAITYPTTTYYSYPTYYNTGGRWGRRGWR